MRYKDTGRLSTPGDYIRHQRKLAGRSQARAAHDMSLSVTALGRLERGEHLPNLDTLERLAKYYDVSLDELVGFSDRRMKGGERVVR